MGGAPAQLQNSFPESTITTTMSGSERRLEAPSESRRTMIIIVAVVAAVVIALFFYLLMRASGGGGAAEPSLQGASRQGSAEFEQYRSRIVLDAPEGEEAKRGFGDTVMS